MSRHRAEIVRFAILKSLKEHPTHGYDLYLMLHEDELVKQPSDLYKVLKKLKDQGLIEEDLENSELGPKKKILHLTKLGIHEYYVRILDSAKIFFDLLLDMGIKRMEKSPHSFTFPNFPKEDFEKKNIYFAPLSLNDRMQASVIKKILSDINSNIKIYIKLRENSNRRAYRILKAKNIEVELLDPNLVLKENCIDFVIIFGLGNIVQSEKIILDYLNSANRVLKKPGKLLFIYNKPPPPYANPFGSGMPFKGPPPMDHEFIAKMNSNFSKRRGPLGMFQELMQTIREEIPEDLHSKLGDLMFPMQLKPKLNSDFSLEKIMEILKKMFENVEFGEGNKDINVFMCSGKK